MYSSMQKLEWNYLKLLPYYLYQSLFHDYRHADIEDAEDPAETTGGDTKTVCTKKYGIMAANAKAIGSATVCT